MAGTQTSQRQWLAVPQVDVADGFHVRRILRIETKLTGKSSIPADGLTLDREADALADGRRNAVGGDAEIGCHLVAEQAN